MSLWTRLKYARRVQRCSFILDVFKMNEHFFWSVENTVKLDKTRQLHQWIRCNICNMANRERKQTKRAVFSFVLQLRTFTTKYLLLWTSPKRTNIFSKRRNQTRILDPSNLLLKRRVPCGHVVEICYYISMLFLTRRAHFRRVKMTLKYSSIFPRRVENVQDASPKYSTIFQCYFGRVMQIFDQSKMTLMTKIPLNSTIFWTRHLNLATRRVTSATCQFNSTTRRILHWNIVAYFDEALSQLGDATTQLGNASTELRDASKNAIMTTLAYHIGYEPADLTVHPPPKPSRVGSFFSHRCLVPPKFFPQRKSGFCRRYSH